MNRKTFGALAATIVALSAVITAYAQNDDAEQAALDSLDVYMEAFNARDPKAWAATLHYPHIRIASGDVRIWETEEDFAAYMDFEAFAERSGWHHSAWDAKEVIQSSKEKVHIAVQFTRYDKENNKLATYKSFYVQTYKNGKWATQLRSSFAP